VPEEFAAERSCQKAHSWRSGSGRKVLSIFIRSSARFPGTAPAAATEDEVEAALPLTWREGVEVVVAIMDGDICAALIFTAKCR